MYKREMNKRIRPDMVYGNTDLEAIHKKANDIAWKLFEEKKKGSDKLQTRYREHLQKTIDIEGGRYDVTNREKISSERTLNETVNVLCYLSSVV